MASSSATATGIGSPASAVPGSAFGYAWTPAMWPAADDGAGSDAGLARAGSRVSEDAKLKRPRMAKWSPDGKLLATASDEVRVRVSKLGADGRLEHWGVLTGHKESAQAVAWGPAHRGQICYTAGRDDSLRVWDLAVGKCIRNIATTPRVIHLAASSDGRFFSASTISNVVSVYDAVSLALISRTTMPYETNAQAWMPDGTLMLACGKKGSDGGMVVRFRQRPCTVPKAGVASVRLGAAACGLEVARETPVLAGSARVLGECPTGAVYAVGGVDSCVAIMDSTSDACIRAIDAGVGAVTAVEFSRDGRYLAIATRGAALRVVRVADGVTVREVQGTEAPSVAPAWHPTLDVLTVASDDEKQATRLHVLHFA